MRFLVLTRHVLFWVVAATSSAGFPCYGDTDGCMRGKPYPVFAHKCPSIRSHVFLFKSGHEADERIRLKSGDRIKIRHWGCGYYVLTFKRESFRLFPHEPSRSEVCKEASALLRQAENLKGTSVFDFGLAAHTVEAVQEIPSDFEFHTEYPVEGDGTDFLQTQVRIDAAGRIGKTGFIEVSLSKGPL
jgi:hypothetical protein